MAGSYDYRLVALSVLIAILGAYAALDLAGRVTAYRGRGQLFWLAGGSLAMGIGIWSMHYVGMLAFSLPIPIKYDWPTALLSLAVAVGASALALFVVSRSQMGWARVFTGGLFMGAAISGLHYIGMASMRMQAMCHYSPPLVTLSIVFAIVFSLLSLKLTFYFRQEAWGQNLLKIASSLLMGAAISVMHYTAMAAASFMPASAEPDWSHAVNVSVLGTAGIGICSCMVLAITVLTCMLDKLQEQSALLENLFEQAPQAVALLNPDYRIIRVNSEFTRVFGYSREESFGRPLEELIVPEESRAEGQRHKQLSAQGKRVDAEGICRRKDGSRLPVSIIHAPVLFSGGQPSGDGIAVYAIYRDITGRKRADEAVQASEARWRSIFENSGVGIALTNPNGGFTLTNRVFQAMLGYTEQELQALSYMDVTYEEDRQRNWSRGLELWEGKLQQFQMEKRYRRKDGGLIWVRNTVSLAPGNDTVPRFALAIVEDITERKHAEEELQQSLAELRALAGRLQGAREEERTKVAREIHDELGQALTSIKLDLASLIRDLPPDPNKQSKAESVLQLVARTIQSIRRISTELRPGILDDLGLVAAVEWQAEEFQARSRTTVRLKVPEENIFVTQERATAIFRIFQETLTNIARHANATRVDVRLDREDGNIVLEVRDNGHGIGPENFSGRSLGILGMRERAILLGGEVVIRGDPGQGTVVTVRIPEPTARDESQSAANDSDSDC